MKKSSRKFQNQNAGEMRRYSVELPSKVADWVDHEAMGEGKSLDQLLRELITNAVDDQAPSLVNRVQRLRELINEMAIATRKNPMQEHKDAKAETLASEERRRRRNHLIELGMEALGELRKIASSEQAAKEAEFRLHAFMVMARLGSYSAAIIRDQEAEDLEAIMLELEEENHRLDEKFEQLEKELREKERQRAWVA